MTREEFEARMNNMLVNEEVRFECYHRHGMGSKIAVKAVEVFNEQFFAMTGNYFQQYITKSAEEMSWYVDGEFRRMGNDGDSFEILKEVLVVFS